MALVVVDVQNDFGHPSGSLYVPGADRLVPRWNAEIEAARAAGSPVCYSQDWHPAATPHFQPAGPWPPHGVAGSWGAELVSGLAVQGEVVRKATGQEDGYSAFTVRHPGGGGRDVPTRLGVVLHARGIRRVVLCGLATDYCVRASALDALVAGFEVVVLREAVGAVDLEPGDGERALAELAAAGAVLA